MLDSNSIKPPSYLLPWLTETNFLTKKLQSLVGATKLEVLSQIWKNSTWWDCHMLGLKQETVLHRDIVITCQNKFCWYARTILPLKTFNANVNLFSQLQTKLLGQILFESNMVARKSLQYYPIDATTLEYHWMDSYYNSTLQQNNLLLWARKSEFLVDGVYPLYLIEIFLPSFESIVA